MSEKKDDKKSLLEWISGVIPKLTIFQIKNQLAEEAKLQGIENLTIENLTVNVTLGDTKYNVKTQFPPSTDPQSVYRVVDLIAPKEPPELSGCELPPGKDAKWVNALLTTAVNSSAATVATMADIETDGADFFAKPKPKLKD